MKCITLWLLSTVSVVVMLFGYHTSTSSTMAGGPSSTVISGSAGKSGRTGTTPGSGAGAGTGGSAGRAGTGNATPGAGGTGGSAVAARSTVTGAVAQTRWGPVQVQLTVSGGKVADVAVVQYPHGNNRDEQINSSALPILIHETTQQQNARIDMVSGATVTSQGYIESLQSALDQARI